MIEYSHNYSDTSGSLWQFKRDESNVTNPFDVTADNSLSFKYKSNYLAKPVSINNRVSKNVKIAILLKNQSNFWRSLEKLLINCKIHLESNWTEICIMSNIAEDTTNAKLYVSIVTLSNENNVKLTK